MVRLRDVLVGENLAAVAQALGVHRSTVYRWAQGGSHPGSAALLRALVQRYGARGLTIDGCLPPENGTAASRAS